MSGNQRTIEQVSIAKRELADKMNELIEDFEAVNEVPVLGVTCEIDINSENRTIDINIGI